MVLILLEDSIVGFSIKGRTGKLVAQKMNEMLEMSGPERIIELLKILSILSETKDLIAATMNLVELYYIEYDSDIDPLIKKSSES